MTRLVASMIVRNEAGRYLEVCLDALLACCDEVRVVDDASDDGTAELLQRPGVEVLTNPKPLFYEHEGRARQTAFEWALAGDPTHLIHVDADEIVTDPGLIRAAIDGEGSVWTIRMTEVWSVTADAIYVRHDGGWAPRQIPVLYQVPLMRGPGWKINPAALAGGREPQAVKQAYHVGLSKPTGASILHLGWASEAERAKRMARYDVHDGGRYHRSTHLESIGWKDDRVKLAREGWPNMAVQPAAIAKIAGPPASPPVVNHVPAPTRRPSTIPRNRRKEPDMPPVKEPAVFKTGKLPAREEPTDLRFASFAQEITLPKVPVAFGHGNLFPRWGMLGNDNAGDCVWASAAHQTMLFNRISRRGNPVFDDVCVLGDYTEVTGYDPADPSTDRGTEVRAALAYRRHTGVADARGTRHRIAAYVRLDPKNWQQLLEATYIFGAAEIGFEFPDTAMGQFNAGAPWDVVPGASIEGGHDVPVVGSVVSSKSVTCITWGRKQKMSRSFYETYSDEAWVSLSPEWLTVGGKASHGFDLPKLESALAELAKQAKRAKP